MDRWDAFGLDLAQLMSTMSKDPSTQVGAAVLDSLHRVAAVGYNGFPRGVEDDARLYDRDVKYALVIHAECNALLNSTTEVRGCTVYTYPFPPCASCASLLIQSGIVRVVAPAPDLIKYDRWVKSWELAVSMYKEAGVRYELITG